MRYAKPRPPIEGLPAENARPRCAWCNRKLSPIVNHEYNGSTAIGAALAVGAVVTRRTFAGRWQCYRDVFCRLSCALDFAAAAWKAGYRKPRRK